MQSRTDSLMEAVSNIIVGSTISIIVWQITAYFYNIPMPLSENFQITGIFTVTSLARQYILRRMFDGKTVWQAIKGKCKRA